MLHNYATRDWPDRDHEKGGGRATAGAREVEEKNSGWPRKSFSAAGRLDRGERASHRLMNRNNSRAIVLFGSFQLTAVPTASSWAKPGRG